MNRFMPPVVPPSTPFPGVAGADDSEAPLYDGLITIDDQQRVVMVNAAATRMFACPAAEMLGSDLSRFIPVPLQAVHARQVRQFLESDVIERHALTRRVITGLRANGQEFLAEATIARMHADESLGSRCLVTAQLRDLSDLRNRMASFTERMRGIIDLAPLAIWITDGDRIVYANKASASLFGTRDPGSLLGRSIYALLRPESHAAVRQGLSLALEMGADASGSSPPPIISERIARLDGDAREVEIAVAALPDHGTTAPRRCRW